jgi:hypothetical protein
MSTERDTTRIVRSWLEDGRTALPDWVRDDVLDRLPATPQRQSRRLAWRFNPVNTYAKVAIGVAAVAVVAFAGFNLLPRSQSGAGGSPPAASPSTLATPSPSPSPSPSPEPTASLVAHTLTPFRPVGVDGEENPRAASITFDFMAPPSWETEQELGLTIDGNDAPGGASMMFYRGGNVFSEPCLTDEEAEADVAVGPTVDDLVTALVDQPSLDVTDPVDVTLAGYSGTYLDLTVPDDISGCARYRPMEGGHIYAQGPGHRWHMWILDVAGTRVLVETNDYPGTPPERLAEEQAIIESLVITP